MLDPARSLALAERVAEVADALGIETALIGAAALAVHRYARGTEDIDLAVHVDAHRHLTRLQRSLQAAGLRTTLNLPDEDDPLGGVLSVWAPSAENELPAELVEVVNFQTLRRFSTPAMAAIRRATALADSPLRCVGLADLIALKLYAGGLSDFADIVQLLARNPEADLAVIREIAGPFDRGQKLDELIRLASMH